MARILLGYRENILHQNTIYIRDKHKIYHIKLIRIYHGRAVGQLLHLLALAVAMDLEGEASSAV